MRFAHFYMFLYAVCMFVHVVRMFIRVLACFVTNHLLHNVWLVLYAFSYTALGTA